MKEYIEREALLKDIEESVVFTVRDGRPSAEIRGANKIIDRIKSAPATDVVEVRHGSWIWGENAMDWGLGGWICSECQEKNDNIPAKPDIHPYYWVGSHFCPNCGAKMDGKEVE